MSGKNTEVGDIFQGVTLENTQGWNKQKTSANVKRYQALLANRHMYSSNPQHNDTVQNIYGTVFDSKIMYGTEVWGMKHVRN